MSLAPIINSTETINSDFQRSINAAFTELHALFGFWPVVLSPYGGARTKAEQAYLVSIGKSDTMTSDHREDAGAKAAVDIDNEDGFRAINSGLFVATMEKYGWHNMTNEGLPFPREPWHFAKHGISTAGEGSTPIDNSTPRKKIMAFNVVKQSTLSGGNNVPGVSLWATLGESVGPIIYKRTPANDPAPLFNSLYGAHTPLSDATWDFFINAYTPAAE